MRRPALFLAALSLVGCPRVNLDGLTFSCVADSDCPPHQLCHPLDRICVGPDRLPDAGDLDDLDGGVEDSGIEEPAGMRCTTSRTIHGQIASWWCLQATFEDLHSFANLYGAEIVDVEVEPGTGSRRVAAVLVPRDGRAREFVPDLIYGSEDVRPYLYTGFRPLNFELYVDDQNETRFAISTTSIGDHCMYFAFGSSSADRAGILGRARRAPVGGFDRFPETDRALSWWYPRSAATTTIAFDMHGEDIDRLLEDRSLAVTAFQATSNRDRFDVVFGPAGTTTTTWVHGVSEGRLGGLSDELNARVLDIDVSRSGGQYELSALLVQNSTVADTVAKDTAAALALLQDGVGEATVGLYLKELHGAPLLHFNERNTIPAPALFGPVIGVYAFDRDFSLDEVVPVPAEACTTPTIAPGAETIRVLLERMLRDEDPLAATALVRRFGISELSTYSFGLGMHQSALEAPPGCDTEELRSRTSLLDQALFYEHGAHCQITDSERFVWRGWLQGRSSDPRGYAADLDALVEELGRDLNETQQTTLEEQTEIIYSAGAWRPGSWVTTGRLRTIACRGTVPEYPVYMFGLYVSGGPDDAATLAAIRRTLDQVMREMLQRALAKGTACY